MCLLASLATVLFVSADATANLLRDENVAKTIRKYGINVTTGAFSAKDSEYAEQNGLYTDGDTETGTNHACMGISASDAVGISYDLGGLYDLSSMVYHSTAENANFYANHVIFYASSNESRLFTAASKVYEYNEADAAKVSRVIKAEFDAAVTARYVGFEIISCTNGDGILRTAELEVFGAQSTATVSENLLLGKKLSLFNVLSDGTLEANQDGADEATDGKTHAGPNYSGDEFGKHAVPGFNGTGLCLQYAFDAYYDFDSFVFYNTTEAANFFIRKMEVYAGKSADDLYKAENLVGTYEKMDAPDSVIVIRPDAPVTAKVIGFKVTDVNAQGGLLRFAEVEAYGTLCKDQPRDPSILAGIAADKISLYTGIVKSPSTDDKTPLNDGKINQGFNQPEGGCFQTQFTEDGGMSLVFELPKKYDITKALIFSTGEDSDKKPGGFWVQKASVYVANSEADLFKDENKVGSYERQENDPNLITFTMEKPVSGWFIRFAIEKAYADAEGDFNAWGYMRIAELEANGTVSADQSKPSDGGDESGDDNPSGSVTAADASGNVVVEIFPNGEDDVLPFTPGVSLSFANDAASLKAFSGKMNGLRVGTYVYDVKVTTIAGGALDLEGRKMTMKIKVPQGIAADSAKLYANVNGDISAVNAKLADGFFVFETTDLEARYVFAVSGGSSTSDEPIDPSPNTGVATSSAAVLLAALAATSLVTLKKRR